ncbi:hypothetical protein TIFTF001_046784 [Ficus carica]|uniref:Secreted protein n=1 Tax=Ficus carica TaxID=3494 RepID=A0AA88CXE3_FICCA|nr:hypothetical protein TIFTF001_046784 [Ficus carica]
MSSLTLPVAISLAVAGARAKAVKNDGDCDGSGHRSGWSWHTGECGLIGRHLLPPSDLTGVCDCLGPIVHAAVRSWLDFLLLSEILRRGCISFVLCLRCGDRSGGDDDLVADLRKWFLSMETALSRYIFRFEIAEAQRSLITDFGLFTQGN